MLALAKLCMISSSGPSSWQIASRATFLTLLTLLQRERSVYAAAKNSNLFIALGRLPG